MKHIMQLEKHDIQRLKAGQDFGEGGKVASMGRLAFPLKNRLFEWLF